MGASRVFITGLGVRSPLGSDPGRVFREAFEARSAVRLVPSGEGEVATDVLLAPTECDETAIPKSRRIFMARAARLGFLAGEDALRMAELDEGALTDAGIYMGCALGGSEAIEDAYRIYFVKRSRRLKPSSVPLIMASGAASHLSMAFGIRGPTHTYSIACASSAVAIGEAYRAVRDGYLDVALAGGTESMVNDGAISAWERLGVLASPDPEGVERSCRPFDRRRTGFVLGEGAAALVLERERSVERRGVMPLAEVVGYGTGSDAHNLTEPHPDGQVRAMRAALKEAGLEPGAVGYLNAHATGTARGDAVELEAVGRVFGAGAPGLAISATKAVHGHLVGAAGALEALITVQALRARAVPPTAHLEEPDPDEGFDLVPGVGREAPELEVAMSNSFAFGGSNATLVFRRV